jgi:capsular exopolysaccharide synthesis family protein
MITDRPSQRGGAHDRRMSAAPEIGRLPLVSAEAQALSRALVTISDPNGAQAEAIRALRTHLMAQHINEGCRAIAVCAASPGVGCTFLAANMAVALSQIGLNTLLVDANLRRPGIDKIIPPAQPVVGLRQFLSSADPNVGDHLQIDVLPTLSVMYAGGVATNAQDLLAGDRFKMLMDFCRRDFDVTIVDTPAANTCSDARRISTVVGHAVIVARLNKTLVHDVKTLAGQLEADRARVVGSILNEY